MQSINGLSFGAMDEWIRDACMAGTSSSLHRARRSKWRCPGLAHGIPKTEDLYGNAALGVALANQRRRRIRSPAIEAESGAHLGRPHSWIDNQLESPGWEPVRFQG